MSIAARSASTSITEVFGVVTTVASTLTVAVDTIGQAAKVGNMHATRWADRTRKQLALESKKEDVLLVNEAAVKVLTRINETKQFLARNPGLEADYNELVQEFKLALNPQATAE